MKSTRVWSRRLNSKSGVLSLPCPVCSMVLAMSMLRRANAFFRSQPSSHPHRYKSKLFYFNPWTRRNIRLEITCIHSITERGTSLRKAALSYWFREENPYSFTALNTEHYLVLFNFSLFLFFSLKKRPRERKFLVTPSPLKQTSVVFLLHLTTFLAIHLPTHRTCSVSTLITFPIRFEDWSRKGKKATSIPSFPHPTPSISSLIDAVLQRDSFQTALADSYFFLAPKKRWRDPVDRPHPHTRKKKKVPHHRVYLRPSLDG